MSYPESTAAPACLGLCSHMRLWCFSKYSGRTLHIDRLDLTVIHSSTDFYHQSKSMRIDEPIWNSDSSSGKRYNMYSINPKSQFLPVLKLYRSKRPSPLLCLDGLSRLHTYNLELRAMSCPCRTDLRRHTIFPLLISYTVEPQWLEHLWYHRKLFET